MMISSLTTVVNPALLAMLLLFLHDGGTPAAEAFSMAPPPSLSLNTKTLSSANIRTELAMSTAPKKKGYDPKWKKKKTLAEQFETDGPRDLAEIGLKGNVKVLFKQGNETKTTMALEGQLLRDVASQAGQFIKYGCGKGECGTCACLVDGQWVRPCSAHVPAVPQGQDYVIQVKEVKSKTTSSGKFYSFRSFLMGFWNNLLGMIGFVKYRRNAKKNRSERKEYEDLILQKTLEKKAERARREQEGNQGGLKP
mmetsp:Transcript_15078/g.41704  ORF Transcript_15078/g.41704 Transcript_15078/m.41704 type:complete len:252 (-) Transcript_15078:86-841(-)